MMTVVRTVLYELRGGGASKLLTIQGNISPKEGQTIFIKTPDNGVRRFVVAVTPRIEITPDAVEIAVHVREIPLNYIDPMTRVGIYIRRFAGRIFRLIFRRR